MPPELTNSIGTLLQLLVAMAGAFLFAFWISLVVWTFNDIRARTNDILAWVMASLMVLIFGPIGLLLYFLLRPRETLYEVYDRQLEQEALLQDLERQRACPNCGKPAEADFILCPYCRTELKKECRSCRRHLHLDWEVCPYCGVEQVDLRSFAPKEPAQPMVYSRRES